MVNSYRLILEKRFNFKSWQGTNLLSENLFLWKFKFLGDELSNWTMKSSGVVNVENEPRLAQSLWEPKNSHPQSAPMPGTFDPTIPPPPDNRVSIEVYECDSLQDAHAYLIDVLGTMTSPQIAQLPTPPVGDVAFSAGQDYMLLFSLANLVVLVRNEGRDLVDVNPLVNDLASELLKSFQQDDPVGLSITQFDATSGSNNTVLLIQTADRVQHSFWHRFNSTTGTVVIDAGKLCYHPAQSGNQTVELTVRGTHERVVRKNLLFNL